MQILTSHNLLTNFKRQGQKHRSQHFQHHTHTTTNNRHYEISSPQIRDFTPQQLREASHELA
jgi:hypothetical protein